MIVRALVVIGLFFSPLLGHSEGVENPNYPSVVVTGAISQFDEDIVQLKTRVPAAVTLNVPRKYFSKKIKWNEKVEVRIPVSEWVKIKSQLAD